LADRKELHVHDLVGLTLIGYGLDTPFGQLIEQMFQGEGTMPRLSIEVRLTHIACAMVQAGAGVAIVDELAVIGRIWPDVVVRPILPATVMPVNMLHLRYEPLSRLAQDFIDTLSKLEYHNLRAIS
jgi:DNA-binding transcriptional LysR family regulator